MNRVGVGFAVVAVLLVLSSTAMSQWDWNMGDNDIGFFAWQPSYFHEPAWDQLGGWSDNSWYDTGNWFDMYWW